ncbi:MAG TPA: hypothetical protein VGO00_10910, partial [Kofleriaceae bacterium]|nr:hypothetical protein [Kofleriaceae bacterium]
MTRSLLAIVVVAGCSFRSSGATDAASGDDDARRDASDIDAKAVASCDSSSWADALLPGPNTIYVAATTSSTIQDGTQTHPYTSLSFALGTAHPGDRISLAAGTYGGSMLNQVHGTATAPIWIEGPTSAPRAVFTGTMQLVQPQYVVIRHVDFANIAGSALAIDDGGDRTEVVAHHIAIDDVTGTQIGQRVFLLTGVSNVAITRSSAISSANGILLVGCHHVEVSRFTASALTNIAAETAGGSDDVEIRQSKFTTAGLRAVWIGGNSLETEFRPPLVNATGNYEAANIRVFDNVINTASGGTAIACSLCTSSAIAANYIYGQYSYIVRLIDEHGPVGGFSFVASGGIRMADNAMEVTGDPYGFRVETGTDGSQCTFANNLWYEVDAPANSMPTLPTPESNGIYGVPSGYDLDGQLCTGAAAHA